MNQSSQLAEVKTNLLYWNGGGGGGGGGGHEGETDNLRITSCD